MGICARDRIELALEDALRLGWVDLTTLRRATRGGRTRGDQLLREVLELRSDEPPAESFAEVRATNSSVSGGWCTNAGD